MHNGQQLGVKNGNGTNGRPAKRKYPESNAGLTNLHSEVFRLHSVVSHKAAKILITVLLYHLLFEVHENIHHKQ